MTFKEKLARDHPDEIEHFTIYCPCDFDYESDSFCESDTRDCVSCWNREMPETNSGPQNDFKADYERLKSNYEELYDKYKKMEEDSKTLEVHYECSQEMIDELRVENDKLKAIIRTIELLLGGKILD